MGERGVGPPVEPQNKRCCSTQHRRAGLWLPTPEHGRRLPVDVSWGEPTLGLDKTALAEAARPAAESTGGGYAEIVGRERILAGTTPFEAADARHEQRRPALRLLISIGSCRLGPPG
jgi:hypothetical protein